MMLTIDFGSIGIRPKYVRVGQVMYLVGQTANETESGLSILESC